MDDFDKSKYLSSFSRRNTYVNNAADIISPAIKKQLNEYEYDSDSEIDSDPDNVEELSDQDSETSENSEDAEHLKSNAYSYVPKEYTTHTFSDEREEEEEEEGGSSNEAEENEEQQENQGEDHYEKEDNSSQVPPLDLEFLNRNNSKTKLKDKSNSKTDSTYLNKVFYDLEKNLSDVRIEYQVSLSNSAIESSVRKKNCRLSHPNSISSRKSSNNTNTNNNASNSNKENTMDTSSITNNNSSPNLIQRGSKEFDLNKWFDELPEGLKNFVELESSTRNHEFHQPMDHSEHMPQPTHNLRTMGTRNMYLQNITSPLKRQTLESTDHTDDTEEEEGYIDILKKDYIEPIKDVFNQDLKEELKNDFKNLKNELVELYNKSPKILQDIMGTSETLSRFKSNDDPESNENPEESEEGIRKERTNNLNLYYLETKRDHENADYLNKKSKIDEQANCNTKTSELEKKTVIKPKKDENKHSQKPDKCKVYDIFDKYESFDITDQPKLTHVSSFDISRNNQNLNLSNDTKINEEDDFMDEDTEKKVIKSIGDYNIGFLSNLSRVNEKYQLLKEYQINSNLIKPWFLNPLNEKIQSQSMCNQKQMESDRFNRNKEDKKYVLNNKNNDENIKYIINKENNNIKYLIDGTNNEIPNKESKNKEQERFTTLYQLESYYNDVDLDPNDSDRNKFYDPILHFKNYEDKKKKSINHTDWATFGRPLVKRIH